MEDAMRQEAVRQRQLFEDPQEIKSPPLPEEVRGQATLLLTQWMEALANSLRAGGKNEQD
jgi:hypothetical protein